GSAIANMIRNIDARMDLGIDAMLITRGGGSREDLDCFDDVELARAIHDCATPIVAAIGHESDTTIAELVADRRAATPTQAMMVLLPDREDESQRLDLLAEGLNRLMDRSLSVEEAHLNQCEEQLVAGMWRAHAKAAFRTGQVESAIIRRQPHRVLAARRSRLESAVATLESSMQASLVAATAALEHLDLVQVVKRCVTAASESMHARERLLAAVGPQTILSRGYSLTTDPSGRIIKRADQVSPGQVLHTRLAAGFFESEVTNVEDGGESAKPALPSGHG
ncbi:MAG: hypothetical protein MK100_09085, partial [Phycisphaerales bacterium]|nr:hypothetical protein [Phycisphaerales bacterium]